jgi:plastocyanin
VKKLLTGLLTFVILTMFGSLANAGTAVVRTQGDESFQPNAFIMSTLKFSPGHATTSTGSTMTWVHADQTPDPHTVSIVQASDLPRDIEDVFECEVCGEIFAAHEEGGFHPVVDVGAPGLDQPGDSLFLPPGGTISAVISAPAGTTLHYLCAIHPWMQGSITVG